MYTTKQLEELRSQVEQLNKEEKTAWKAAWRVVKSRTGDGQSHMHMAAKEVFEIRVNIYRATMVANEIRNGATEDNIVAKLIAEGKSEGSARGVYKVGEHWHRTLEALAAAREEPPAKRQKRLAELDIEPLSLPQAAAHRPASNMTTTAGARTVHALDDKAEGGRAAVAAEKERQNMEEART